MLVESSFSPLPSSISGFVLVKHWRNLLSAVLA